MKRKSFLVLTMLLLAMRLGWADVPTGFSWVNIESDKTTMTAVRHALHDPSITAIREVGLEGNFALVMTASREAGAPTPDYDLWSIYNISLATGKTQLLISGYGVTLLDWIGPANHELALTYYNCWECEAAKLLTTLHFVKSIGWKARWPNKSDAGKFPQPGALVSTSDIPDSSDEQVDVVFAVISTQKNGSSFAVGSWLHQYNAATGKIDDDVERYSVGPTDDDRTERLTGQEALKWERTICSPANIMIQPRTGQSSKICRDVLRGTADRQPSHK
jgi:hypothetical protein